MPGARHRVAEDVHARLRVGRVARAARRRRRRRCRARPRPARAGRSRRRARRPPGRPRPRSAVDSNAGGSHSSGTSSAAQTSSDQRRPADVEEQRPRGVGDVDRVLAGQPQADVVLRQQDVPDRARRSRARGARSHSSFGAVKPVSARFPVSSISRSSPIRRSISAHSAPVRWSFQRIAGRSTRRRRRARRARASGR